MKEDPHSVDIHVGKNIRVMRLMRKISQTELGERVGVTFQQIQKYEKGANRVSASMLVEIAAALNVDVRSFFDNLNQDVPRSPYGSDASMSLSRDSVVLNAAFLSIRDGQLRKTIVKLVQSIASQQVTDELETEDETA